MTDNAPSLVIQPVAPSDFPRMQTLHARVFGPGRFARTAYRVRAGAPTFSRHCRTAWQGERFIGSVSMTAIVIGDTTGHWLLGPLAVLEGDSRRGVGRRLVEEALASISQHESTDAIVVLVGDLSYYARIGFGSVPPGTITLPGPADPSRILAWPGPNGDRALPCGLIRAA